jgi:hypothetical protein
MQESSGLMPPPGWQALLAAELAEHARSDPRVLEMRVHGSATGNADAIDAWSDLDLLITALDARVVAQDLADHIGTRHSPIFTSHRSDGPERCTLRLVLTDLRRIDITVASSTSRVPLPAADADPELGQVLQELAEEFRFEAALAAVKAARGDMLIGAHLTLGLARHVLVAAMLVRDHDEHTTHHRYGGTRHDVWAARLASAPAPHDQRSITAAIRHYTQVLGELLAERGITLPVDEQPLWTLLDAVDATAPAGHCDLEAHPGGA